MPHARQQTGSLGESAAADFLVNHGYEILTHNWHAGRWGEIDIVAQQGDEIVFVEVKSRKGTGFGNPEDAVTIAKQKKLQGAAQAFLLAHPHLPQKARFDVVAVLLAPDDSLQEIKHFKGLTFA